MSEDSKELTVIPQNADEHALAPYALTFSRVLGPQEGIGLVFERDDFTAEEWLEEGKRIAAGYDFVAGTRPWVIADFIIAGEDSAKVGEKYTQALNIFTDSDGKPLTYGRMKNIVSTGRAFPRERRSPVIKSLETHSVLLGLEPKEQDAILAVAAEGVYDPVSGKTKQVGVRDMRTLKANHIKMKAQAAATGEVAPEPPKPQPAFHYQFRARKPDETWKAWDDACDTYYLEAKKRYKSPDYAAKQDEADRQKAFKELMKDIPKLDQAQFQTLLNAGKSIKEISDSIKGYKTGVQRVTDYEHAVGELSEKERAPFRKMLEEGVPETGAYKHTMADIRSAIKASLDKKNNRAALKEALKEVAPVDHAHFYAKLDAGEKLKDVKKAVKDYVKVASEKEKRDNDIKKILEPVAEADRGPFLEKAHAGMSIADLKSEVNAHLEATKTERNKLLKARKEERDGWRKDIANKLKAVNTLRESKDPSDHQTADTLEEQVKELQDRVDASETEDAQLTGAVAASAGRGLSKSEQAGRGKGKKPGAARKGGKKGKK
jgi:hypothetical protein